MATDITNSSNREDDCNERLHTFYRYVLPMQDITLNVLQYNTWDDTWHSPTITIKTINGNIRFQLLKTDIVIRNLHEYIYVMSMDTTLKKRLGSSRHPGTLDGRHSNNHLYLTTISLPDWNIDIWRNWESLH
jgi:hypothetical protein